MLAQRLQARRPTTTSTTTSTTATHLDRRRRPMAPPRATDGKTGVLFVCLGNICRSPTAEAVFRAVVERRGLAEKFFIDSCGTGGGASNWYKPGGFSYHEGDAADSRMAAAAIKRGVRLTSRSRPLKPEDWSTFRHVVCMDGDNVRAVKGAVQYWEGAGMLQKNDGGAAATATAPRVSLMTDWAAEGSESRRLGKVPDPYYGGPAGFDKVLDLLDEAAEGLLDAVLAEEEATGARA